MKRLVLAGGGHAHAFVLEALARDRPRDVEVVLVAPHPRQLYSGMLPGWIAGTYALEACALPLDRLARRAGVRFVQQACVRLDVEAQIVECADGRCFAWDWLSLDVGSASAGSDIPGAALNAVPVRPLEGFVAHVAAVRAAAEAGAAEQIVMVGGGAAGIELAFALQVAVASSPGARVTVVDLSGRPLAGMPGLARRRAAAVMRRRGIAWIGGRRVAKVDTEGVTLDDGRALAATRVFLVTGAIAHDWLAASALAADDKGFVRVCPTLQSVSHPNVFAAGDCAALAAPRPRSGVFAVRAGPPLAANLVRAMRGEDPREWWPQRTALYLVSTGPGQAIAAWGPFAWWGGWVWRWKDRIDRAFIARFAG